MTIESGLKTSHSSNAIFLDIEQKITKFDIAFIECDKPSFKNTAQKPLILEEFLKYPDFRKLILPYLMWIVPQRSTAIAPLIQGC